MNSNITVISALEKFVERLVDYVPVNQQNMTFPDFLVLMSQRRNSIDHQLDSNLHPGIDNSYNMNHIKMILGFI